MASSAISWIRRNRLLSIAVIVALAGIILLILGSSTVQPVQSSISNFSSAKEGAYLSITGIVRSFNPRDRGYTAVVCESSKSSECITALVSKSATQGMLFEGDFVTLKGSVRSYLGETYLAVNNPSDIVVTIPNR